MKETQATLPQTFYIKPGKFIWSYLGTFLFMLGGCIETVSYTHLTLPTKA